MIKIDLEKKLHKVGLSLSKFKDKYIEDILNYEHPIVSKQKGKKVDRFSLGINIETESNIRYKLESIFFDLYNLNNDLQLFIDTVFQPIANLEQSRDLLEEIILMEADDIKNKIADIDAYRNNNPNEILKIIFDYKRDRERYDISKGISPRFKEVDFRVCIYCNRNFISNFDTEENTTRATYTLDHFYQKDKYPIFSLSLYNLIPSCAVCNTNIKGTRNVEQYNNPYSPDYDFENEAEFKIMPDYKVKLVSTNSLCQNYIRDFYHNEVYETHSLEVKEFVKKRGVFTDDMIKKVSRFMKHPEESMKAFLFGEVLYKDNVDSESLGKLKVDLAIELGIIPKRKS